MIEYAIRDSVAKAIQAGVTPQAANCDALWAITWRAWPVAWMVWHHSLLETP